MVIASSTWVRPAQALIHSDSGEVRYFPPRNRGSLPRALTFHDHPSHHDRENLPPFEFLDIEEQDYLIASGTENFHLEDPPDEYTSFEREYSRHSRDLLYSWLSQEAPSMSTPTDQYVNNVLMLKRHPNNLQTSMLSSKQLPYLSSASDTQNDCMSPLLQSESGPSLSLNDLVELYSKKLQMAKATSSSQVVMSGSERNHTSLNEKYSEESTACRANVMDRIYDTKDRETSNFKSPTGNPLNAGRPMQLMVLDTGLLLQELKELGLDAGQQNQESTHFGRYFLSTEQCEAILFTCYDEKLQLVYMDE